MFADYIGRTSIERELDIQYKLQKDKRINEVFEYGKNEKNRNYYNYNADVGRM